MLAAASASRSMTTSMAAGMMERSSMSDALEPPQEKVRPGAVRVPRWPIVLALIAAAIAYAALPQRLRLGPPYALALAEIVLIVPLLTAHSRGYDRAAHYLGRAALAILTLALVSSTVFLVDRVPGSKTTGTDLLRDGALIWAVNIVVFGIWYWEVDAGGPGRRRPGVYRPQDFAFPQFQLDPQERDDRWIPDFFDYLFLAFNTSTAFSPTDTMVLSRKAKALMMCQSLISLVIIGVLISRAINTIQ